MKGAINVIIAEDDTDLRESLQMGFTRKGLNARIACGGRQVLNLLNEGVVDAIVMDVRMPEGTGLDVIENVKGMGSEKPSLICMSGYPDLDPVNAYKLGVDAYFQKPVSCDLLVAATVHFSRKRRLIMGVEKHLKSLMNPGQGMQPQSLNESIAEALELFTALWSYAGILNEAVNAIDSRSAQDVRLKWCNKKIEEYCARLSQELVKLQDGIVKS